MEVDVEELKEMGEVEVIKEMEELEESPQYMHTSQGLKRLPPLTHQPLPMERSDGQAFRILAVQTPL